MVSTERTYFCSFDRNDNRLRIDPFMRFVYPADGLVTNAVHQNAFVNSMLSSPSFTALFRGYQHVDLTSPSNAPDNPNSFEYENYHLHCMHCLHLESTEAE